MSRGSPKQGSQEFLRVSPAVLTRLPASTDASACSRFASSLAPLGRHCRVWPLGHNTRPPSRSLRRAGVKAARPQVHVALLPLVQNRKVSLMLEVLLHLQVFSRRQPRRHAVLRDVPWSTRTLVSWLCTPSYYGTPASPNAPLAAWRQSPLLAMNCLLFQRWF